eukprot:symbB.v1.2.006748.t1/scaffold405.1/size210896/4
MDLAWQNHVKPLSVRKKEPLAQEVLILKMSDQHLQPVGINMDLTTVLQALNCPHHFMRSNWQPPWVEDQPPTTNLEISLQRLQEEDESTVYDWAMALDGFCSFVANLAVAARVHHQVSTSEPSSGEVAAEVEIPESPATIALVVVVPNNLCEWHLEVLGPLLRAFKIFMLTEKAWRADFNAASSVPFSVEAAAMAHAST